MAFRKDRHELRRLMRKDKKIYRAPQHRLTVDNETKQPSLLTAEVHDIFSCLFALALHCAWRSQRNAMEPSHPSELFQLMPGIARLSTSPVRLWSTPSAEHRCRVYSRMTSPRIVKTKCIMCFIVSSRPCPHGGVMPKPRPWTQPFNF